MLVLTRRAAESIHIGRDVVVEVIRVRGDRVCLGIHAPESVRILRSELRDASRPRIEGDRVPLAYVEAGNQNHSRGCEAHP